MNELIIINILITFRRRAKSIVLIYIYVQKVGKRMEFNLIHMI